MKRTIISLLTLVFVFASCKKTDNIPPVINSMNIAMNDTLSNYFTIKVDASDNKGIGKVEYIVNDSLLTTITVPPYDYQLNTLKMKDGSYSMKAIAYDSEGNKIEVTSSFVVQNSLLSLKIGSIYPYPYHIVVSDEKGNILNTSTFSSNENRKILPLTPCNEKAINIVYYYTSSDGYTYMTADVHVKRGSELKIQPDPGPIAGSGFKLHLKNDISAFSQIDIITDLFSYTLGTMADTVNLPVTIPATANHKLLLQLQTGTGKYYKLISPNNGQSQTVSLSSVNTPETKKTFAFTASARANYIITGRAAVAETMNEYYISSETKMYNEDHLDLIYPSEYFAQYMTYLTYNLPPSNKTYTNVSRGAVPNGFTYLDAEAQVTNSTPAGFKATFSGNFDCYTAYFGIPSLKVTLKVNAPANQKEWVLPNLSTAFSNSGFSFDKFKILQLNLSNLESVNLADKYYDLDTEQLIAAESHFQGLVFFLQEK
jgi:hypothetical protein